MSRVETRKALKALKALPFWSRVVDTLGLFESRGKGKACFINSQTRPLHANEGNQTTRKCIIP